MIMSTYLYNGLAVNLRKIFLQGQAGLDWKNSISYNNIFIFVETTERQNPIPEDYWALPTHDSANK